MSTPVNQPPHVPLEGRPHCHYCNKRMSPNLCYEHVPAADGDGWLWKRRYTGQVTFGYGGTSLFCSLRCGHAYAVRAIGRGADQIGPPSFR